MRTWILSIVLSLLLAPAMATAQDRDVRGERIVLDDAGGGGTTNTMTIMTDPSLATDVILTIPDPGTGAAQFLLAPPGSGGAWLLGGNAGTTFGTDLLGTSDIVALQIGVDGGASNSLILNTNWSIQRDNGGDARGTGSVDLQRSRSSSTQVASGNISFIGAGASNTASGAQSFIGAGVQNSATSTSSAVVAGFNNTVTNQDAFIGGGASNTVSSPNAAIVAGHLNNVSGIQSFIGGGFGNGVSGISSMVGSGENNNATGNRSAIPGGQNLSLSGANSFGFNGGAGMLVSAGNAAVFGNVDLWLANNNSAATSLRFYEAQATTGAFPAAGTNYTSFTAGSQTADITYTLPTAQGGAGQVLHNDGSGNLNWAAAGTSGVVFNRVTTAGPIYNAASTDGLIGVDVSGGPVTVNLPAASTIASGCIMLVNVEAGDAGTNNVTINAAGGDTFDGTGATSLIISFGQGQFQLYSDGANGWFTY